MNLRPLVVKTHRWLSLTALCFWFLQATTGVFAVFHWEIDDAIVPGPHRPTDLRAIERSLPAGVTSIWTSAGAADRYDVNLTDRVLRIDGVGNVLRVRHDGQRFAAGGFVETLVVLHHDLLAGDRGRTIVGISGVLLLSNVLLGIVAALPRVRQLGRALRPLKAGSRTAVLYSWHRAVGLWIAIPMLCSVTAGVLMAFEGTTERLLGASVEAPVQPSTAPQRVGMADAVDFALARFPGAAVSGISFPTAENAGWRITLRQREEPRRAYGKTRVFVSAIDGRILGELDALNAPPGRRLFESLFAFHTGEMGGMAGRVVVLLIGVALIALIVLGVSLWAGRAPSSSRASSRGTRSAGTAPAP